MALQHLNTKEFEQALQENAVAMVDFSATWCGPCRMLAPTVEKVAQEYAGKALVAKVDIDESEALRDQYGIMSVPTVVFFKNGQEVDRKVGVLPAGAFAGVLNGLL